MKRGDIVRLGGHVLMCGDATDPDDVRALFRAAGGKAQLLLTDPPYGVDIGGRAKDRKSGRGIMNDALGTEGMAELWRGAFALAHMECGPKASFYCFAPQGGPLEREMAKALVASGWETRHTLVWVKTRFVLGRCDYHYRHEPILYGWKSGSSHVWLGGRSQCSVLQFGRDTVGLDHPTQKPKALLLKLVANHCAEGELVYDPFLGSGSALMACEMGNRRCAGMELDPWFASETVRRWEKFTGRKAKAVSSRRGGGGR